MGHVHFILGIHNHQPTGNFHHVFQWAYEHAYKPFLDILKEYPDIKISIHHSGPLIDWLLEYHPDYIQAYKELASRGNVEIMGGAYYEPILPIIPDEDKVGQLILMKKKMKELFDYDSIGVWVPERVWEPFLPRFINEAGYRYVVLDDVHFLYAGLREQDLTWFYSTEDTGRVIMAFPDLQILRYMIPFKPVEEIRDFFLSFRDKDEDVILVMADDGEKFGVWPGTYKHVYENGWLLRFFDMLSTLMEEEWFSMITFKDAISRFVPKGRVYMPTSSYIEMTEWVLPYDMSNEFTNLVETHKEIKPFLRGGHWRMFFSKYYESNLMKSRMLEVSRLVSRVDNYELKEKATHYLYKGQTNCAYWHGVFGGLYLPHLRRAVYQNLIEAEKVARGEGSSVEIVEKDFDSDGVDEILFRDNNWFAVIDKSLGAIMELDVYKISENVINVMARYREAYHDKVYEAVSPEEIDGTKTIHEVVLAKEKDLQRYLVYDKWNYMAFMDFLGEYLPQLFFDGSVDNIPYIYKESEIRGASVVFSSDIGEKVIKLKQDRVEVYYDMKQPLTVLIPVAFYDPNITVNIKDESEQMSYRTSALVSTEASYVSIDVPFMNVRHVVETSGIIKGYYPIFTVSNSESGFEKIYQGTVFVIFIQNGSIVWRVMKT